MGANSPPRRPPNELSSIQLTVVGPRRRGQQKKRRAFPAVHLRSDLFDDGLVHFAHVGESLFVRWLGWRVWDRVHLEVPLMETRRAPKTCIRGFQRSRRNRRAAIHNLFGLQKIFSAGIGRAPRKHGRDALQKFGKARSSGLASIIGNKVGRESE